MLFKSCHKIVVSVSAYTAKGVTRCLAGKKCTLDLFYGEISALDRQGPFLAVPPSFAVKSFIPSIQSRFPVERPRQTDRQREGGPVGGRNLWRTVNSWRIFPLCSETAAAGGLHMHLVQLAEPEMHLVRAGESRQDEVLAFLHREGSLRTVSDSRRAHL